jgi:hypothetical protein
MDDLARGVATAALTLQSVLLQALVNEGAMTPAQALEVVDKAIAESLGTAADSPEKAVERITVEALEGVREGIADMVN